MKSSVLKDRQERFFGAASETRSEDGDPMFLKAFTENADARPNGESLLISLVDETFLISSI